MGLRVIGPPADGVKRGGYPGGAGDVTDSYTDKLVKLVPAEAISVYPLLKSQADLLSKDSGKLVIYVTAWVLLLIVVVLRWKATSVPGKGAQWGAVLIAAVAFFIWVHVVGGDFGFAEMLSKAHTTAGTAAGGAPPTRAAEAGAAYEGAKVYYSSLALTTWTLLAPAVYKGDQQS